MDEVLFTTKTSLAQVSPPSWCKVANRIPGMSVTLGLVLGLVLGLSLVAPPSAEAAGAGITYHGRLIDPNGNAVVAPSVQFRLQLRTPGNENCIIYEELQTKDMSNSAGIFSVTINDNSGVRTDSSGYSIDQVFANKGSYTFASGQCATGTTWTPNSTDGRRIQVSFNDGTLPDGSWEQVPSMNINFVPMAIEAMQVGGARKEQLLRVAEGVSTTGTELSNSAWTELLALLGGTSTQYVGAGSATFTAAPQWSGVPSGGNDLVNKTYVDAQMAAGLPNVGTPGTYGKVTTDTKGRVTSGAALVEADIPSLSTAGKVSGAAITSGAIGGSTSISSSGNLVTTGTVQGAIVGATNLRVFNGPQYVQLAAPVLGGNLSFVLPAADGATGTLMKTDGSGQLSFGALAAADIPALDTNKLTTGTLPIARGGTGLTSYGNNSVLVSNGTGSAINSLNCTNGEVIKFDVSGFAGCATDSTGVSTQWTTTGSDIYYNTGKVGIGTATPAAALHLIKNDDIFVDYYTAANSSAGFVSRRARGTSASPAAVQTGDTLGNLVFWGYNGSSFATTSGSFVAGTATENFTGSAQGSNLVFYTTPNGSTTRVIRASIDHNGNVGVGTTSPSNKLTVVSTGSANGIVNEAADSGFTGIRSKNTSYAGYDYGLTSNNYGNQFYIFDVGQSKSRLQISNNGNFFINPNNSNWTPAVNTMDVNGAVAIGASYAGVSTAPSNGLLVEGNVGIGTTTPSAKLEVSGDTKLNGSVQIGWGGVSYSGGNGACRIDNSAISTTPANYTCAGVPATSTVSVTCSGSQAMTTPTGSAVYCRASGTADQVICNTTIANSVSMDWFCSWVYLDIGV